MTESGSPLGSVDFVNLKEKGGLLAGLKENFTVFQWFRGHLAFIGSLGWTASWSFARPPLLFVAPLAFLIVCIFGAYILALRRLAVDSILKLPLWGLLPVLLGFSYHVLVRIALTGKAMGTSGYYLHFAVIFLGIALGVGFGSLWHVKKFRLMGTALAIWALALSVFASWAQLLLYAGILYETGASKVYRFPTDLSPGFGLPEALSSLEVLAFPQYGLVAWILGASSVFFGLAWLWLNGRKLWPE